jgi:spermidine/putrescine transport system permease protein
LWLLVFFVVPLVSLISTSLYDPGGSLETGYAMTGHVQNYFSVLADYRSHILRSFGYAAAATIACIVLGYPLAYAIAFKAGKWKNLMLVAVIAPFFTSFLIRTLSWQMLLGDQAWFADALRFPAGARPGRAPAGHALRGGHRADVQLPALHGPAALHVPGKGGPQADGSRI